MPGRFLRDGILWSRTVNKLSEGGENFYRRLMSVVDDFGRCEADIEFLTAACYPIRRGMPESDVVTRLNECIEVGLVRLYEVDGKQYLEYKKLGEPRAKKSKHPEPPEEKSIGKRRKATLSNAPPSPSPSPSPTITKEESASQSDGNPSPVAAIAAIAIPEPTAKAEPDKGSRPGRKPPSGPYHEAIRHFQAKWKDRYGEEYHVNYSGQDGKMFSEMLKKVGGDGAKLNAAIDRYFDDPDPWVSETARHGADYLSSKFHRWISDTPVVARSKPQTFHDHKTEILRNTIFDSLLTEDDPDDRTETQRIAITGSS